MARKGKSPSGGRCLRQVGNIVDFPKGEFLSVEPDRRAYVDLEESRHDPRGTVRRLFAKFAMPLAAGALEVIG